MPFLAGVHYHDRFIMNSYLFRGFMITNVADADHTNTAFERFKYFINEEMDSTVFVSSECKDAIQKYADAGIRVTTLPNEPVDQIIGVMLFHKLNAIMEDRISLIETELSSTLGDNMVYIHSENEITNDIEIPSWWTSPDLVHAELEVNDGDTIYAIPSTTVTWRDLELLWPTEEITETGNVVFADFGKDETK
jgi:hypothetical protein